MAVRITESFPNVIGGRRVSGQDGAWFVRANPASVDEVVCRFPEATTADLEAAVAAARQAQPGWAATPAPTRGEVLRRAADLLATRGDGVAEELTREEGKTLAESRAEVQAGIATLRYMAGLAAMPEGEVIPSARPGVSVQTMRQPRGVVAALTPWNFPFSIPCIKVGAALAAGNAVIFKPSPYTPLSAWRIVEALAEAGLPDGVLNFLTDSSGAIGKAMVAHPGVAAISFTGSTATGRAIAETAARRLVPCQLELGGKNALVVLDDADLDLAAAAAVTGAFGGTGQKCTATGRAIVAESILEPFLDRVLARAASIRVGPGMDDRTTMGPVVARERLERILTAVSEAERAGARLVTGGRRLTGEGHDGGFFMGPTLLSDVSPASPVAREEVFGPVLPVIAAADEDEALRLANAGAFGLSGAVFTRDVRRAFRFARASRTGIVKINEPTTGIECQAPSGGWGDSGLGEPELGPSALHFFTAVKAVYWSHGNV
ncbi:MAG TPA: aldehyde dehydrogenase family protein [Thermodesulfobacteriota bacterium]